MNNRKCPIMEWTLERINGPRNFVVLGNGESLYSCGRKENNQIICPSIVVSRRHCVFVRADNKLSVIDLQSSNGIFINGVLQTPNVPIDLHENDLIGIGSAAEYRENEPMFLYKLHKGNLNLKDHQDFHSLPTQRSTESNVEHCSNNDADKQNLASHKSERCAQKRHFPTKNTEEKPTVHAPKVTKLDKKIQPISDKGGDCPDNKPSDSGCEVSPKVDITSECEENEEVWSTFGNNAASKCKGEEADSVSPVLTKQKKKDTSLNVSNIVTGNPDQEKSTKNVLRNDRRIERETLSLNSKNKMKLCKEQTTDFCVIDTVDLSDDDDNIFQSSQIVNSVSDVSLVNAETNAPSDTSNVDSASKMKLCTETRSRTLAPTDESQDKWTSVHRKSVSAQEGPMMFVDSPQTSHKTVPSSLDTPASSTRLTANTLGLSENLEDKDCHLNKSKGGSSPEDKIRLKCSPKLLTESCHNRNISKKVVGRKKLINRSFDSTSQDRHMQDKNEANISLIASTTVCNLEHDDLSTFSETPVLTSSPFKVKLIKPEPKTDFCVIDTVDVSDDDDNIFPSSQLFNSVYDGLVNVKIDAPSDKIKDDTSNVDSTSNMKLCTERRSRTLPSTDESKQEWVSVHSKSVSAEQDPIIFQGSPETSRNIIPLSLDASTSSRLTINTLGLSEIPEDKDCHPNKDEGRSGTGGKRRLRSTPKLVPGNSCNKNVSCSVDSTLHDRYMQEKNEANISPIPSTSVKLEYDELSMFNKSSVVTSSPFKVKFIKQEPKIDFSVTDTVDLSDDDDNIFPSSQLFNSMSEADLVNMETDAPPNTIKLEQDFDEDNKDVLMEVGAMQDGNEIIVLSDSDDEENPWLHRLSESQRIKEELPASPKMEFVDELAELSRNWTYDTVKEIETEASRVEGIDSPQARRHRAMTFAEIGAEVNKDDSESAKSNADFEIFRGFDPIPLLKLETKTDDMDTEKSPTAKMETPKGLKIIEPLPLAQRKRASLRNSSVPRDCANLTSPTTSKADHKLQECSVKMLKVDSNLTAKQQRELQIADRVKQKRYEEEQRIRRLKNKWVKNVPLPLGKKKSLPISKKQRMDIVSERKEKLKELAAKQKASSTTSAVERIAAKPKAKVSTKTRGDFLISEPEEALTLKATTATGNDQEQSSTSKDDATSSTSSIAKSRALSTQTNTAKTTNTDKPLEPKNSKREHKGKALPAKPRKRIDKRETHVEKVVDSSSAVMADKPTKSSKNLSLTQKENRMPNLLEKNQQGKSKKTVTFSTNLVTVKEYYIESHNTLKKCVGKDALIPKEKLPTNRRIIDKTKQTKLQEFLMYIFSWNPSWLEEQKHLKIDPPIVKYEGLVPLLTNYKNYKEYYQIMIPLLLLELWHGITKEFETIDRNRRCQTMFCSIVQNSITTQKIPDSNVMLTNMMLEILVSDADIRNRIHPVYGDLIFLELYYRNDQGKPNFLKVFAYITHHYHTSITPNTYFNRDLVSYVQNPSKVITYTVSMKPLKVNLCMNRILRLRCVTYLRANIRSVQALQSLPNSPLLDLILNPKVESYKLSSPTKQEQSSLITRDKLNSKQLEAVFKTTEAIVRKEPKVCLVQGPPGTGKSHVIVNMVMQVLYGDNRYRNKETGLRILLCAPSNAAIDEIVLRLLSRRAKLLNNRFKMVRVGLLENMHPQVRDISVEELAKRDVKRTIANYKSSGPSMDSIEEEKKFLEAGINSVQSELTSSQCRDQNQIEYVKMKLFNLKTRYDLIKNCNKSTDVAVHSRDIAKLQRSAENTILTGADIIACTLSSCYTNIMEAAFGGIRHNISVCIVDEATQSCEVETLIPLMLGVNTLVLVGDPAQLPATVISQKAKQFGLDQSLFSRAQRAFEGKKNYPVIMLDTQYRMDVAISHWPNQYFYRRKLKNAVVNNRTSLPFHPYRVMNLDSHQNTDKFSNTNEAEFVASLIYSMINHMDLINIPYNITIGVITPYRNQQTVVRTKIQQRLSPIMQIIKEKVSFDVNTIDSFQGHESDIIIMSCVRTNGIGFLADPQRLCVALTRAKHCLVLCGNFATFQRDAMWSALLSDAQLRRNYIKIRADASPNEILTHLVR